MKPPITSAAVPRDGLIAAHLTDADFFDAYTMPLAQGDNRSALAIYLAIVAVTPGWINFLMATRNRVVSMVGLKDVGHVGNVDPAKAPAAYRVEERVGSFSLLALTDEEIILGDADRHVDAWISLRKLRQEDGPAVVLSTVVHIHNLLGRGYMLGVVPLHRRIVPAALARAWEADRRGRG
ncbi:MAG: DUF2867 domain-containing protein [Rhodocyclaceae bacterium]|jgi:hypothetical protein|nr:DUF2867 domain-containing protein [Rhodocyclaceae bacterium]